MHAKARVDPRVRCILDLPAVVVPSDPALWQLIDLKLEFDRLASSALQVRRQLPDEPWTSLALIVDFEQELLLWQAAS